MSEANDPWAYDANAPQTFPSCLRQVFDIWAVPFHKAEVKLVTVLQLERRAAPPDYNSTSSPHDGREKSGGTTDAEGSMVDLSLDHALDGPGSKAKGKWFIASQEDLYQTDQFMRFLVPQLAWLVVVWQVLATWACVVLSYLFEPVTWWEEERQREFLRGELGDGDEGRGEGKKRR
ncbi:hypothetical protein KVT40_005070 [Elsinoe batatas]|uniref:SigF-like NTF2-like domain-containing protein n=1 Tax=Elsinoe batatas TaxID=2601811 RepID=A0A8K0PGI7_9PEZI|nr:hypothetical protein KVT40_005070 [Elsinoe batatas]